MQLNENTIQVLRNFAGINSNLVINEGNELKTIAEAKNVYATVKVPDTFSSTIGIYDLNELLKVLDLVDSPNFDAQETYAIISDGSGRSKVKYHFTDIEHLTTPTKTPKLPEEWEVKFTLDQNTIQRIRSAAGALGHKEVRITPDSSGIVMLTVCESENKTSNTFSIEVPGEYKEGESFEFYLHIDNLKKIFSTAYEVNISSKLISFFQSTDQQLPIEYLIALEKNSKYGE